VLFCPKIPFLKYGELRGAIFVLRHTCAPTAGSAAPQCVAGDSLNLQIELAFAGLAAKLVVTARTIAGPVGCRPALAARVIKRALPYFVALAVILTARQATTIEKPLSAEAWPTFGIEGVTGL
jgi:hypothetical protein